MRNQQVVLRRAGVLSLATGLVTSLCIGTVHVQAAEWRVYSDYVGTSFLLMKSNQHKLRFAFPGDDWSCFAGTRRGGKYRGKMKTVIDSYRGWARIHRVPRTVETPPGLRISYNYGYGTHRGQGWLRSSEGVFQAHTGMTVAQVVRWCSK